MFLGQKISKDLMRMYEIKVKAILGWPIPKLVSELRSFLGLANYYQKFLRGYSRKVAPLTNLLKQDQKRRWDVSSQEAFEELKEAVASEPVLRLPEFDKPFEMHTDASDKEINGLLVQEGHPIAFEGRKLHGAELRYSTHETEMLLVISFLQVQRHYLLGTKFIVKTNNLANTYFQTKKKLSSKQAYW